MSRRRYALWDWLFQLVVLAGLPIALWTLTGNPIPSSLPSWLDIQLWWNGVQAYPAQAFDIVPRILVDALWIGWAWYAAWLALGLLWTLLRLPAVILPRTLLRLTPRTTVHALAVGAVAASPAVHAAPAHAAASAAPLPASLNGRLHLALDTTKTRSLRPSYPLSAFSPTSLQGAREHEVVHGDTLWDLAVHYYGDGEQWHRIYTGNIGHPQPDGRYLTDPKLILPGWKLTIPHTTAAPPPQPPHAATGPATTTRATPPPPNPHQAPATASPDPAAHGPNAPATPAPARTAPAPGANGRDPAPHPAADPRVPHTVGWHLPGGGYVGITLIAAVAASVALLRTRQRLHPDTTAPIPPTAQQLTAVHDAAKQAKTHGHLPQDYQGEPPPVLKPQPGLPTLGTYPSEHDEAGYHPGACTGPLAFDGPGAPDAVRALALSLLGATDLDDLEPDENPLGLQVVLIDRALARDLFAATPDQDLPGWLHLTDTPAAAVAAFHATARRHAAAGIDAEDFLATDQDPYTALIARTDPALHDAIVEASLMDPTASLGAILLGTPPPDPNTTQITIHTDGTTRQVTGPRAGQVRHLHLYHLPREQADEFFQVLYATRAVYRQPPTDPDTPTPAHDPEPHNDTEPETEAEPAPPRPETDTPAEQAAHDPRALADTPLLLRLLGPIDVLGPDTALPARGERTRAILTALALHPSGLRTGELADLAWDEPFRDDRTQKQAVYAALRRVRDLLRATADQTAATQDDGAGEDYVVLDAADRYQIDPAQITTDLQLRTSLETQAERTEDPPERLNLLTQAAELHRGTLADGLDDNRRDWLTTARYHALQHTARLHLRIAELAADTNAHSALRHLKQATALAPDDESTAIAAIGLYHRLDRPDLAHALEQRPTD